MARHSYGRGIILLRAALAFLIHWEIKGEEKECEAIERKKQRKVVINNS